MIDRGRLLAPVPAVLPALLLAVLLATAACATPVAGTAVAGDEPAPETSTETTATETAAPPETGAGDVDLSPLVGTWTGEYTCLQGETGMTMTIDPVDDVSVRVILAFFPLAENPGAKKGSFQLVGSYDGDKLLLRQQKWIDQPAGYSMVDFEVTSPVEPDVDALSGNVLFEGCRGFAVRRG